MKTIIVGGNFGIPKESGIVRQIGRYLNADVFNGGTALPSVSGDLMIWMPNIPNEEPKHYPKKPTGSVLICSKLMHDGVRKIDAISRIFKMHGNAVICIYPSQTCRFELIDALANVWYSGENIQELCKAILDFTAFTNAAIRLPSIPAESWINDDLYLKIGVDKPQIDKLISINKYLSQKILTECGGRFFGNVSTRCQSLFPSVRSQVGIYVSPRNSNKESLGTEDMVLCAMEDGFVSYYNGDKPSVDAPIQLEVYASKPEINFMIHGHAFINLASEFGYWRGTTENYRLCGDFREAQEILAAIGTQNTGALNLKKHGFLLFSTDLNKLEDMAKTCSFYMKEI